MTIKKSEPWLLLPHHLIWSSSHNTQNTQNTQNIHNAQNTKMSKYSKIEIQTRFTIALPPFLVEPPQHSPGNQPVSIRSSIEILRNTPYEYLEILRNTKKYLEILRNT